MFTISFQPLVFNANKNAPLFKRAVGSLRARDNQQKNFYVQSLVRFPDTKETTEIKYEDKNLLLLPIFAILIYIQNA